MIKLFAFALVLTVTASADAGIFRHRTIRQHRRVQPAACSTPYTHQAQLMPVAQAPQGGHWSYQTTGCANGQCTVKRVWVGN